MPFPPDGFHRVAKDLKELKVPSGEGRHRTVVGRAYYSAYLATCQAICRVHKIQPPGTMNHKVLSTSLAGFKGDPGVREFGILLNSLRVSRVQADYLMANAVTEDAADDAVEDARKALDMLQTVEKKLPKIDPSSY